jgi:hypothetical protein
MNWLLQSGEHTAAGVGKPEFMEHMQLNMFHKQQWTVQ